MVQIALVRMKLVMLSAESISIHVDLLLHTALAWLAQRNECPFPPGILALSVFVPNTYDTLDRFRFVGFNRREFPQKSDNSVRLDAAHLVPMQRFTVRPDAPSSLEAQF